MRARRVDIQLWRRDEGAQPADVKQLDRRGDTAVLAAVDRALLGDEPNLTAWRPKRSTECSLAIHIASQPPAVGRSNVRNSCDELDDICLLIMIGEDGRMDDAMPREDALSHDEVVLFDVGRAHEKAALSPHDEVCLYVPRRAFAERVGRFEEFAGLQIRSRGALAALFTHYLADLSASMPTLTREQVETGMDGVLHLLVAIILTQVSSGAMTDAPQDGGLTSGGLLARAERCIDASLGQHELDAAALARMLGVSRQRLYKAFTPRGGVSTALRDARLDRARIRCASPDDRHHTLAEVAYACGFTDYSSFSRAFRRRFGISPRDARSR